MRPALRLGLAAVLLFVPPAARGAQQAGPSGDVPSPASGLAIPSGTTAATPPAGEAQPVGVWERDTMLGDLGGLRRRLSARGVSFGLQEQSELLGNATGGTRRQAIYEGTAELSLGLDLGRLVGLEGGMFNVSAWQIHGRGLSLNALGNNLHTVSSDEALRGTLLFELWYEQTLLDGRLAVRLGQLAADEEFMISQYATLFVNHTFGFSTAAGVDIPSGGPAYPLATPGVRVRMRPGEGLAVLAAVFNGDPAGPGPGFPQDRNPSGTAFRTNDGVFAILEAQLSTPRGILGLPGTLRLGAWYDSQPFADLRMASGGSSLAVSTGQMGRARRGNWGAYGVLDQMLWRPDGASDGGVGAFARVMGSPGDRSLVNFYADAGVTWKAPFPGRDNDTAGLAVAYARVSDTAAKLDSDTALSTGLPYPIRRHETVLELTYQYQVAPWWQVQPDAQYLFNLGGGIPDPRRPARRLGDAAVFGVRTQITF